MIKAFATSHSNGENYLRTEFDAEPFFEHVSFDLFDTRMEMRDTWAIMWPQHLAKKCLEWTIENRPTPELLAFQDQSGGKTFGVSLYTAHVRSWMERRKIRKTATNAVTDLLDGGEQ